jgi:SHS family lactate transporter-like MFS transporter
MSITALEGWTREQTHAVAASYLAWTMDAFDYFILVFVLSNIAGEFHTKVPEVALAVTLTLAMRPVGAFVFGRLADRYGRRPVLMINIAVYSLLSFATAFVPNLAMFLLVRAAFGFGMGGIWGISTSLAFESIKTSARGLVSGLLQSGYSGGYLFASIVFALLFVHIGWRGMFMVGIVPALLLIPYIYTAVPESPVFRQNKAQRVTIFSVLARHGKLAVYAILLMTAFNFFSHGTQDFYPTFLSKGRGFAPAVAGSMAVIYNIGAILGCFLFGPLSQHFGRRRMMIVAALLALPTTWLWAFSPSIVMLTLGAFLINFFVQGCWSCIPIYLNELSPPEARGTFPGTVYQLGNLIASGNLAIQAWIAEYNGDYGIALAAVPICAGLVIALLVSRGPEADNVDMASGKI